VILPCGRFDLRRRKFELRLHQDAQAAAGASVMGMTCRGASALRNEFARLFGSLILLTLIAIPSHAIEGFALQRNARGHWHLVMPSEAAEVLRDSLPDFEPWPDSAYSRSMRRAFDYDPHTAPFAIVRDLNRDGLEDFVLDGRSGRIHQVVLVVSSGNRYRVVPAMGLEWPPRSKRNTTRPGHGLRVGRAPASSWGPTGQENDSTWVFAWAWQGDDFAYFFTWSDSLGLQSKEI
jgi:hypothetical protein